MKRIKLLRKLTVPTRKAFFIRLFLVFFFFFAHKYAFAQTVADLVGQWNALKQKKGYQTLQNTVDLLNNISSKYVADYPDSGLYFGNLALQMANSQQYAIGQVRAINNVAKSYYVKGSYDSSLYISDKALKLSTFVHDSVGMGVATSNIGLVYLGHEEFDKAIAEFEKALTISTAVNDSLQMVKTLFNLGVCYDEKRQLPKALEYFTKTIAADPHTGDHRLTVMTYNRLGKTEYYNKDYNKGIEYYEKVLNSKSYSYRWENSFACQGLAEIYYDLKQYNKAVDYAKKAFDTASLMNAKWDAEQALAILSKSLAASGDYRNAYKYHVLDGIYEDSMYTESKQQVESYFKLQAKEAANEALIKQNKLIQEKENLARLLNIIISAFACTLLVAILLLYRSYRAKLVLNRVLVGKNENISRLNQMKDQLFSVVSHDLRGPMLNLQQTLQFINEGGLTERQQKLLLEGLGNQVTMSNQMLTNLLTWAATQRNGIAAIIRKVDPVDVIKDVIDVFEIIASKKNINIIYNSTNAAPLMADENQLRIIVQNLLGNAIKFTPENGSVNIYHTLADTRVIIHVSDTGVGIGKEKRVQLFQNFGAAITSTGTAKEKGTGIGLMIVKEFANQNNANISIKSEIGKGTTFSVSFPAAV